jgi:hypothetical protein
MTPLRSIPVLLLLFSVLTVISGCARKKPVLVVVPQEQPPIAAPTPAPTPAAKTEPSKPEPEAQPAGQPSPAETADKTSADKTAKTKPRARQHATIKKPSPIVKGETTAEAKPPEPRSTPAPIAPSISPSDAARDQSSTEQLLQTTENTLNAIKRQLSKDEEAMVAQIRNYISQSRQASKDNDPARAHNLALKANLLSNELVRR